MKFGSYELIDKFSEFAVGYNKNSTIQPYVVWERYKDTVINAVFYEDYGSALDEIYRRLNSYE